MRNHLDATPAPSPSSARLLANKANAAKSTGPITAIGKAASRLNAVKTGLTGRTVLLPSDDAASYTKHIAQWQEALKPVGPRECSLVQSIADSHWRTDRITRLEFALWAQGNSLFADQFAEEPDAELRQGLIEMQTMLHFERQLRNLHLQESRIRRAREKDTAELKDLQRERKLEAAEAAHRRALAAQNKPMQLGNTTHGFVFSTESASLSRPNSSATAMPSTPEVAAPKAAA